VRILLDECVAQIATVLVTIDQGFEYEHNLQKISFGIVIFTSTEIGLRTTARCLRL
jgi:hypothetical protein